jgi:hypothetical protein
LTAVFVDQEVVTQTVDPNLMVGLSFELAKLVPKTVNVVIPAASGAFGLAVIEITGIS